MKDILELLHKIGELKDVKRKGWVLKKVPSPESVADHSFRISVMALLLAEDFDLDKDKCIQMALIHDIAEAIVGDITPHDNISTNEKHELEEKAIKSMFKDLGKNDLIELWLEYKEQRSPEAKFIKELDKIETILQTSEYEQKYPQLNLSEFWPDTESKIKDPRLIEIFNLLKEKRQ